MPSDELDFCAFFDIEEHLYWQGDAMKSKRMIKQSTLSAIILAIFFFIAVMLIGVYVYEFLHKSGAKCRKEADGI